MKNLKVMMMTLMMCLLTIFISCNQNSSNETQNNQSDDLSQKQIELQSIVNSAKNAIENDSVLKGVEILKGINYVDSSIMYSDNISVKYMLDSIKQLNELNLKSILKNFDMKIDNFDGDTLYIHKTFNVNKTWNKTYLELCIINRTLILTSHYYGNSWIFHTKIKVKIGDNIYMSNEIPIYSDNNIRHNSSGSVWELLYFGNSPIINAIYQSKPDEKIQIRLIGEYYEDYILSDVHCNAIKDTYKLNQFLKISDKLN